MSERAGIAVAWAAASTSAPDFGPSASCLRNSARARAGIRSLGDFGTGGGADSRRFFPSRSGWPVPAYSPVSAGGSSIFAGGAGAGGGSGGRAGAACNSAMSFALSQCAGNDRSLSMCRSCLYFASSFGKARARKRTEKPSDSPRLRLGDRAVCPSANRLRGNSERKASRRRAAVNGRSDDARKRLPSKEQNAERRACEIRLRAERKAGQLLTKMPKAKLGPHGDQSSDTTDPPKLKELAISKDQSSQWQKLAAMRQRAASC